MNYEWLTEGSPLQWLLGSLQHDFTSLVKLLGGYRRAEAKFDTFFGISTKDSIVFINDTATHYWHGNEPDHHVPFLYVLLDIAWKTQALTRHLILLNYGKEAGGISGNDDGGQMSAWYIWATLGLYPLIPGAQEPWYILTSPAVDKSELVLPVTDDDSDHKFVIYALNNCAENVYVQSAYLEGIALNRSWIYHSELFQNSNLTFVMGPVPNVEWPGKRAPRPPIMYRFS